MEASPLTTGLAGLLIWVPITVALLTLVGWLIMGDIEALFGFTAIGVLLGMGFLTARPPNPEMPLYLTIAAYAIVLLFPSAKLLWHRREMRQMELDAIQRAYSLLEFNRGNLGAKLRLARSVQQLGYGAWAYFIGEGAVQGLDTRHYKEEMLMVKDWGRESGAVARQPDRLTCPKCAAPVLESDLFCDRCGGHIVWLRLRGYYGTADWQGRVLWAWLMAVVALVAIPWFRSALRPDAALLATLGSLAVVVGLVIWAFLGGRKTD